MEKVETFNNENVKKDAASEQKHYRLIGIMLFCVACGLLAARSFVSWLSDFISSDTALDTIFSLLAQVGVLVVVPIFFYVFAFKFKPKEILEFSSIRKTKPHNYILAIAIGILAVFVTMGISTFWQIIIRVFGYTHSSGGDTLPDTFNFGYFFLTLFLSAILPGICEEFMMRGGYLTTIRKKFSFIITVIIMGISFGLFHQNITQVFYTTFFGALMAALTLKCGSIIPAMIIHFFNNGTGIFLDSAEKYGWVGGDVYGYIDYMMNNNPAGIFGIYILICAVFAGLVFLFWRLNGDKRSVERKAPIGIFEIMEKNRRGYAAADVKEPVNSIETADRPVPLLNVSDAEVFRPALRDNIFYIGAAVTAVLTTIFTFVWGWIV